MNTTSTRKTWSFPHVVMLVMIVLSSLILAACAGKRAVVQSPVTLPGAFTLTGTKSQPDQWWKALSDKKLNALIDTALGGNFDLRIAWNRVDQSRAMADAAGAGTLPSVSASGGLARMTSESSPAGRVTATNYSLGLAATYELDLWGRVRSTRDAARIDLLSTRENLQSAAITVSGQVANTWYQLVGQRAQIRLLDEQMVVNAKQLEIMELRFGAGQVAATSLLQQQRVVESVKGERITAASAAKVLEHQLAMLLGSTPGTIRIPENGGFPVIQDIPKTGIPAELVRRRPDVRTAELRVQSADRRAAAAVANQFPKISLSASTETSAGGVGQLFDSWLVNLAGNVTAPLFQGGALRAEVRRTKAVVSEKVNTYGKVVLSAIEEVESALVRESHQAAYVKNVDEQTRLARIASEQKLDYYSKGTITFDSYLTTLLDLQRLQRTQVNARQGLVLYRIALHRALAGRWNLERPLGVSVSATREGSK